MFSFNTYQNDSSNEVWSCILTRPHDDNTFFFLLLYLFIFSSFLINKIVYICVWVCKCDSHQIELDDISNWIELPIDTILAFTITDWSNNNQKEKRKRRAIAMYIVCRLFALCLRNIYLVHFNQCVDYCWRFKMINDFETRLKMIYNIYFEVHFDFSFAVYFSRLFLFS